MDDLFYCITKCLHPLWSALEIYTCCRINNRCLNFFFMDSEFVFVFLLKLVVYPGFESIVIRAQCSVGCWVEFDDPVSEI